MNVWLAYGRVRVIAFSEIIDDDDGDRKPHANATFDSSSPSGEADAKAEMRNHFIGRLERNDHVDKHHAKPKIE